MCGEGHVLKVARSLGALREERGLERLLLTGMRRHLVACLGDAFVDVQVAGVAALPSWGEDAECQGVSLLPGGSCANAARHLASIGREELSVSFFTCIGDDESGRCFL